jgi:hypothetical protein
MVVHKMLVVKKHGGADDFLPIHGIKVNDVIGELPLQVLKVFLVEIVVAFCLVALHGLVVDLDKFI